ncbi:HAD-IB family hydrolase [Actinacidiphila epipremni]|uniref:HAD-IB family hydrolase n=1 Tax=Actinacidiphila epipremni TaxID=2053013 RepID=A0ABX0ZM92_9ACTN|nr:HAD-IB family hydrolase [Actinacidiphila epipremni]NJP43942.1 HAD-IB family hydrolase [Actinacidiphila epipremni]
MHVLLTGATGFLGQAMLERLIVDHPDARITVLVRRRGDASAADRLAGLARKPVFRTLRERIGAAGVRAALAERVDALEGDLGSGGVPALPGTLTAVLHCASTVSFDPPVDEAFRINVLGARELYEAVLASGASPHVVHVSTAYVSALHRGVVAERSLDHAVDWRGELRHAQAAREAAEVRSRTPGVLGPLLAAARAEHGKAGTSAVAAAAERARRDWVHEHLVTAGRLRGQSLGWTDVYTFTKALGERVAEEYAQDHDLRVSVLRPTIVQAALDLPYPGWFESYKMMDPITLAYGRGEIREFPVHADSVVDIVPVDVVTSAALAVAAAPPEPGRPAYFHVGTGARNPLTQDDLHRHVKRYFTAHPLPDAGRGHVKVPPWRLNGAAPVERALRAGERAAELVERALPLLPASARLRERADRARTDSRRVRALRRLLDLYGGYGGVEAVFGDANTIALHRGRPPGTAGFDVAEIDWPHYVADVYCPAVTAASRRTSGPRRSRAAAGGADVNAALPEGRDVAALFDLEGTVLASNLVEVFVWTRLISVPPAGWAGELASLARAVPGYVGAERRDRGDFVRAFMRRYAGCREAELRAAVAHRIGDALLHRSFPEAVARIRAHRAAGHRTVLITGTADLFVQPLAPLFDEIAASRLQVRDGLLTGRLERPPVVGEARAAWARRYAETAGLDLRRCYAYGDSFSDRALLDLVGNPVAVNPDHRLHRHAAGRAWRVEEWGAHTGGRLDAVLTALSGPARAVRPAGRAGAVR